MNIYTKNAELLQCFKDYESKFERMNQSLNQRIDYSHLKFYEKTSLKTNDKNYQLFRIWLEKYREKIEIDYYKKNFQARHYINDTYSFDESIKSFNYFSNEWPINVTGKPFFVLNITYIFLLEDFLIKEEQTTNADLPLLYALMSFLCDGYFVKVRRFNLEVVYTNIPFCLIFLVPFKSQLISCMIGLKKLPIFDNFSGVILNVKYSHQLFFLDIGKNKAELIKAAQNDVSKQFPEQFVQELETFLQIDEYSTSVSKKKDTIFTHKIEGDDKIGYEISKFSKMVFLKKYRPNTFSYISPKGIDQKMYFSDTKNIWNLNPENDKEGFSYSEKYDRFAALKFSEYFKTNSNFKKAAQLVEFLERIPNFAIKLTRQEKSVIGQGGNVLVLGRSGTGKTTCLLLRLFAMEFLFKLRMKQVRKKFESLYGELNTGKFKSEDIDQMPGLHSIFVTASPVLCQEVKNYYEKLKGHVKIELIKKEEVDIKKKEETIIENKEKMNEEAIEDLSFESFEDEKGEEVEKLKIKIQKDEGLF